VDEDAVGEREHALLAEMRRALQVRGETVLSLPSEPFRFATAIEHSAVGAMTLECSDVCDERAKTTSSFHLCRQSGHPFSLERRAVPGTDRGS
jgi:hypothetical protein